MPLRFLNTLFNHELKEESEKQKFRSVSSLERLKLLEEKKKIRFNRNMDKLEEAYEILLNLSMEFSQTVSYITLSAKMTPGEYHERYLEKCKDLNRCVAIIDIHFPQLADKTGTLSGKTNIFWGGPAGLAVSKDQADRRVYD